MNKKVLFYSKAGFFYIINKKRSTDQLAEKKALIKYSLL